MPSKKKRRWILIALLVVFVFSAVKSQLSQPDVPPGSYLVVEIEGDYAEGRPQGIVARLIEETNIMVELLGTLSKATRDDRIAGLVVKIGPLGTGWAQTKEIRDALSAVKDAGKPVFTFLTSEVVTGNKEYYLASAGDKVYVARAATPLLAGLSAQYYFLGGLWEKVHLSVDVEQIREYKTFGDMISRHTMSEAHREVAESVLTDLNDEFLGTIAEARHLSLEEARSIIDSCPSSATDFVEASLADDAIYDDELAGKIGGMEPINLLEADDYQDVSLRSLGLEGGEKIAVVYAVGTIVPGSGGRRGAFGMQIGSQTLTEAFEQAADDDAIKAIVFRIDSPGGSASASDAVWRSVRLARQRKPVVASLSNVAASGGYYMAAGADHVVAEPNTLTGSIGVVMFKPDASQLLDWMGIGTASLSRGRFARILDVTKGLDRGEKELLKTQMDGVYKRFLDRVAEGREMTVEEVDRVGGGRVWTGNQALDAGLVDQLGGLRAAIRGAAVEAGVANPDNVELVYFPEAKSLTEQLAGLHSSTFASFIPSFLDDSLAAAAAYVPLAPGIHTIMVGSLAVH